MFADTASCGRYKGGGKAGWFRTEKHDKGGPMVAMVVMVAM